MAERSQLADLVFRQILHGLKTELMLHWHHFLFDSVRGATKALGLQI